jgi:flagellar biosynthesis/type III secretory pathway chaperone
MTARQSTVDERGKQLFTELIAALHAESDALVANDGVRLADAVGRKQALLAALAPQANALRRSGDGVARLTLEAARLNALNSVIVNARANATRARVEVLVGAAASAPTYGANGRASPVAVAAAPRTGASV